MDSLFRQSGPGDVTYTHLAQVNLGTAGWYLVVYLIVPMLVKSLRTCNYDGGPGNEHRGRNRSQDTKTEELMRLDWNLALRIRKYVPHSLHKLLNVH